MIANSAEAATRIQDHQQKFKTTRRIFEKTRVLYEEKLWIAPTSDDIAQYLALCEAQKPKIVAGLTGEIKQLKERTNSNRTDLDKDVDRLNSMLQFVEGKGTNCAALIHPHLPIDELEVEKLGVLDGGLIISITDHFDEWDIFEVRQVIDSRNMIVKWEDATHWISNLSTAGLVDGQYVIFANVMKVTETKTYPTALGSKTVFVLEPLDTRPADAALARLWGAIPESSSDVMALDSVSNRIADVPRDPSSTTTVDASRKVVSKVKYFAVIGVFAVLALIGVGSLLAVTTLLVVAIWAVSKSHQHAAPYRAKDLGQTQDRAPAK